MSDSATLWTVARQAPLSMGFSRQEYWSGLPCLPAGDLLKPLMELESPALQADSLPNETPGKPRLSVHIYTYIWEKEMATHSSILAWRIPWIEEPGGLLSMGSHRVRHY